MSIHDTPSSLPDQLDEEEQRDIERKPDSASEDQVDEAVEETFPASDPISP